VIPGFIGATAVVEQLRRAVLAVRDVPTPVVVTGETGTGKEAVALALCGNRRPVVVQNCAGLTDGTAHSQIFGHERGAFSDARAQHQGWIEQANGGALVLDEFAELAPNHQVQLLRALEGKPFQRLGGQEWIVPRVRFVLVTNTDLEQAVADGGFRRDLYARCRLRIAVPPLRERPGDVPLLVRELHRRLCLRDGTVYPYPPSRLVDAWMREPWPENVRGLEREVEAFALGLDLATADHAAPSHVARSATSPARRRCLHLDQIPFERVHSLLTAHGGHRAAAAADLGVDVSTLSRWLRKGASWRPA
jgi:DNA-binding NtrC family response regulator